MTSRTHPHPGKAQAKALAGARRWPEARQVLQQVCSAQPQDAEAHYLLGAVHAELGMIDQAIANYLEAVRLKPNYADVYNNLGALLETRGNLPDAIGAYQRAADADPNNLPAHYNLGRVYNKQVRVADAVAALRRAAKIAPNDVRVLRDLAYSLKTARDLPGALEVLRKVIRIEPRDAMLHNQLGNVLQLLGDHESAIASYRKAQQLNPQLAEAFGNMGATMLTQGRVPEAQENFRTALKLKPHWAGAHSNLLFAINYTGTSPDEVFAEHLRWSECHAGRRTVAHHGRDCNPRRRLRVGYSSPDLKAHSVAFFLESILRSHDRSEFEIFCYSDVDLPDSTTLRLQGMTDGWRDVRSLKDAELVRVIAQDRIDILVDLAGHTGNNRLLVFAERPAPVQVTYLGYPNTTGLRSIDYRITDSWADPVGAENFHTEQLVRMPHCFICYNPPFDAPPVAPPPMIERGYVTFGTFNACPKITEQVVTIWARILHEVPDSRFMMKNSGTKDSSTRERYIAQFAACGIGRERLELVPMASSLGDHLNLYAGIDIALDPFPYNGTTTTCEALWMGVPVVTVRGGLHAGRVGVSLLNQVGLEWLIADDHEDYVRRAVGLARQPENLAALREQLRERMAASPLCDAISFTRDLERAYRQMWRDWCAGADTAGQGAKTDSAALSVDRQPELP